MYEQIEADAQEDQKCHAEPVRHLTFPLCCATALFVYQSAFTLFSTSACSS